MLGTVARLLAYRRKPRLMLIVRHPVHAVRIARLRRTVAGQFSAASLALALTAAALAAPLGAWLGRKIGRG